jgi:hypothetical protein
MREPETLPNTNPGKLRHLPNHAAEQFGDVSCSKIFQQVVMTPDQCFAPSKDVCLFCLPLVSSHCTDVSDLQGETCKKVLDQFVAICNPRVESRLFR